MRITLANRSNRVRDRAELDISPIFRLDRHVHDELDAGSFVKNELFVELNSLVDLPEGISWVSLP